MHNTRPLNEAQKKWIEDLRSGEYKQGRERMYIRDDDSFCCLGVAAASSGVDPLEMLATCDSLDAHDLSPYVDVLHLLGLNDKEGSFKLNDEARKYLFAYTNENTNFYIIRDLTRGFEWSLMKMNDDLEMSFEQIADFIETFSDVVFR